MKNLTQLTTALLALTLLATGCTKKRDAALPEDVQTQIFAISDFGTIDSAKDGFGLKTTSVVSAMAAGEQSKAINEKGRVNIDLDSLAMPQGLKFMFRGFEMQGTPGKQYPLVFSLNQKVVTAYKVVTNVNELSTFERSLVMNEAEVKASYAVTRTRDAAQMTKLRQTMAQEHANVLKAAKAGQAGRYLVPVFTYPIAAFGAVEQVKNDNGDLTANKRLKATEWTIATHVQIVDNSVNRQPIGKTPGNTDMDHVFLTSSIDKKVMTGAELKKFGVAVNVDDAAKVYVVVNGESLAIYKFVSRKDLTEAQLANIKAGRKDQTTLACPAGSDADCALDLTYKYKISIVVPERKEVTEDGGLAADVNLRSVRSQDGIGLIKIADDQIPETIKTSDLVRDARNYFKLSDIQGKEFYYRRSFEAAAATSGMTPGMSGDTMLVRFELRDGALVLKKTTKPVAFKSDKNALDDEEIMSLPAIYVRERKTDDAGSALALTEYEVVNKERAEFVVVDWRLNTIPNIYSPMVGDLYSSCVAGVNAVQVSGLDQRLASNGVLNFSIDYTVTTQPSYYCQTAFEGQNGYSLDSSSTRNFTHSVKERVSLMVNDHSLDQTFANLVPFPVQNMLGYGVWTMAKQLVTDNGVTGRDGQQADLPGIHDFRNGKKLVYTLGGLPEAEGRTITVVNEDGKAETVDLRELYIELTKEVVADWNNALHKAFDKTELARGEKETYIDLEINGEKGAKASLGDLDKNFLWYEDSTHLSDYGTLFGVSQPATNARSGAIASNNVIMYSGNIRWYAERERHYLKLVADYNALVAKTKEEAIQELKKSEEAQKQVRSGEVQVNGGDQSTVENRAKAQIRSIGELLAKTQFGNEFDKNAPIAKLSKGRVNASRAQLMKLTNQIRSVIGSQPNLNAIDYSKIPGAHPYIHTVVQKVLALQTGHDDADVEMILIDEMLNSLGKSGKLSSTEAAALQKKSAVLKYRKALLTHAASRPGCMDFSREGMIGTFVNSSFRAMLKDTLKQTLVHEMGHSLGLTHNFIASYDKENFQFADEKEQSRIASSVMDYIEDKFLVYGGPGPYDVHALRAAYTGTFLPAKGKKLVTLDEIKAKVGQWTQMTPAKAAALPIKTFLYCTDKDVRWEPVCQRHDMGGSAVEIVDNIIKDYNDAYIMSGHDYDRLTFGYGNRAGLTSRALNSMLSARMFMDEFIYKAITREGSDEVRQDYAMAGFKAYRFLLSVIGTPDASGMLFNAGCEKANAGEPCLNARHVVFPYKYRELVTDENGEPVVGADGQNQYKEMSDVAVIQRKSVGDISTSKDRYETLGIEIDKLLALQILTLKGFPHPKYEQISMTFSYLDFEKFVLGVSDPMRSPTINMMLQLLKNDLRPTLTTDNTFNSPLPSQFSADVTQNMRAYAGITAVLGLESTTLADKDNFATLFKVGTSVGATAADRAVITQIDAADNSTQRLGYHALDNATVAQSIVSEAQRQLFYVKNGDALKKSLSVLLVAQLKANDAAANPKLSDEDKAKAAQALTDAEAALVKQIGDAGATAAVLVPEGSALATKGNVIENVVKLVEAQNQKLLGKEAIGLYKEIAAMLNSGKRDAELMDVIEQIKGSNAEVAKAVPLAGLAQTLLKEFLASQQGAEAVAAGLDATTTEVDFATNYGYLLNSVDFLAKLTRLTNPEFTR